MKKLIILITVVIVIVLLLHAVFFVFVNTKGKDVITAGIKKSLGIEASIESLSVSFPFSVNIEDFKSEGLSFKEAKVSLGSFNPFTYRLVLNRVYIDSLKLKLTKGKDTIHIGSFLLTGKPAAGKDSGRVKIEKEGLSSLDSVKAENKENKPIFQETKTKGKKFAVTIRKIYLKNSTAQIIFSKEAKSIAFTLDDVNLKIRNFSYPRLSKFYINLKTSLKTNKGIARDVMSFDGWVDFLNKNMNVNFNLNQVDYSILSEYYPSFWAPDNLGIKEAHFSLKTNMNSKNNILVVDGILSLDRIAFTEGGEVPKRDLLKTAVALLKGNKEKATLHFELKTKMDSPKLDFSFLKRSLFKEALQANPLSIVEVVVNQVKDKVEGTDDFTVDTVIDTLKDITGSIGDIFKPKKVSESE